MERSKEFLFDLSGKVAVITGGAGHLGAAICASLAQAGANVVIASREAKKCRTLAEKLEKQFRVPCLGLEMDISDAKSVQAGFAEIKEHFGRLDILVNNAYFGGGGTLENISEENWRLGLEGTVTGVFRCIQAVLPHLESGGSIINIASMYGTVSPNKEIYEDSKMSSPPNYGAGKAAVIQLTRYSACYLADRGIRVNSISPGAFPNAEVQKDVNFVRHLSEKIPLKRIGRPEELQGAVVFLASSSASYVTGINLPVDGGWTAW